MVFQARKRLGELLVEEERIKEQDLEKALGEQERCGQKLGQVLFKMGLLSERVIAEALGRQLGVPVANLDNSHLPEDLLDLIPQNIARNYNVIPIERHYNWVRIAMTDPLDIAAMDEVAHYLRLEVLPTVATESEINRALERYYGMGSPVMNREDDHPPCEEPGPEKPHDLMEQDATNSSVTALISNAISMEATDIHLEVGPDGGSIRMRVDGRLRMTKWFREQAPSDLATAIRSSAGIDESVPGFGDGRFDFSEDLCVRVSTCRTTGGERVVLRLVDKTLSSAGLNALGMAPDMDEKLRKVFRQGGGLILCTGSGGSGKTTTLYTLINHLNAMDKALVTVEDPIEYVIDRVSQTQVGPRAGLSLPEGVRGMLRQDPDILVVGEIKESETANLTVQAALTGITVLSTFCWNDAAGTLVRLIEMGLESSLLVSAVACVVSQRLVRKICEDCKDAYTPPQAVLESINVHEPAQLYRGRGCPACRNTGYRGKTAVFELLFMDNDIRNLVTAGASRGAIEKAAVARNMTTMRDDAIRKALLGITTLEEALNRTRMAAQTAK